MTNTNKKAIRQHIRKRAATEKRKRIIITTIIALSVVIAVYYLIRNNQNYSTEGLIIPEGLLTENINGTVIGEDSAPIKVLEFSQYTCSHCANFALNYEKYFIEGFVETGEVQWEFIPASFSDHFMRQVEKANYCALEQDNFYEFRDIVFANQSNAAFPLSRKASYFSFATALGLNLDAFKECVNSNRYRDKTNENYDLVNQFEVTATPTFIIIVGETQIPVVGADPQVLENTIKQALQEFNN